jgi:hypothetical protein
VVTIYECYHRKRSRDAEALAKAEGYNANARQHWPMTPRIYFDTDTFHNFAATFKRKKLPDELRELIVFFAHDNERSLFPSSR